MCVCVWWSSLQIRDEMSVESISCYLGLFLFYGNMKSSLSKYEVMHTAYFFVTLSLHAWMLTWYWKQNDAVIRMLFRHRIPHPLGGSISAYACTVSMSAQAGVGSIHERQGTFLRINQLAEESRITIRPFISFLNYGNWGIVLIGF